jgi:CheY-like chemotaxis protein
VTGSVEGVKVLIVEDEFLVASMLQAMLEAAGCLVAGPIPRLPEALEAAEQVSCDVAVLDVNLAGERIDPVAAALSARDIPFVFVTGYAPDSLPGGFSERPRLCKPFRQADLLATLAALVSPRATTGPGLA